jgi:hypothetical protein
MRIILVPHGAPGNSATRRPQSYPSRLKSLRDSHLTKSGDYTQNPFKEQERKCPRLIRSWDALRTALRWGLLRSYFVGLVPDTETGKISSDAACESQNATLGVSVGDNFDHRRQGSVLSSMRKPVAYGRASSQTQAPCTPRVPQFSDCGGCCDLGIF